MRKNYKLLLAGLLLGSLHMQAADITVTTSKAVGQTFTLAINAGVNATVTWADGSTDTFFSHATPVDLTLKSQTFKLSSPSNSNITAIYAPDNGITAIDLSALRPVLQRLYLAGNELTELNLGNYLQLTEVDVQGNKLTSLSLRGNQLTYLNCANNQLAELDQRVSNALVTLCCANNQLTELPRINNMNALQTLFCQNNKIANLTLSGSTGLETIVASGNGATSFRSNGKSKLRDVWMGHNQLSTLNLSRAVAITSLVVNDNLLDSISWGGAKDSLFAYGCLSGNKLYFSSMPTIYNPTRRNYTISGHDMGPQQPFFIAETVNAGEQQDWRMFLTRNAWGANINPQITVTDITGKVLTAGTDYTASSNRFTFKTPMTGVQLHVTSRYYPDITLVSQPFDVVDPAGIANVSTDGNSGDGAWYSLQGVRVQKPTKGVFIHNGKKVIIK